MQAPGEPSASPPPRRPAGARAERARKAGSAQLNVIPVDAMRLFVHWFVPADQLRRALTQVRGERAGARLRLRILDARPGGRSGLADEPRQEFAAGGGWHEGFVTLDRPGGSIVAALGIQDGRGAFSALLTSLVVTLPDPAATPAPVAAAPAKEQSIPQLKTARGMPGVSVARSRRGGNEPSMSRILARFVEPETPPPAASQAKHAPAPEMIASGERSEPVARETEATDQSAEITRVEIEPAPDTVTQAGAAADDDAKPAETPATAAEAADADARADAAPAGETHPEPATSPDAPEHFASFFDHPAEGESAFLRARLVVSGRLGAGHRLRIGGEEITARPGGAFSYQKQLEGAPLAWAFLSQAAAMDADAGAPSLEVIAADASADVPLAMRVSIEIEGRLASPAHRFLLPPGIEADASGRFSFIRPLPAGAWFLPQLVLTAEA